MKQTSLGVNGLSGSEKVYKKNPKECKSSRIIGLASRCWENLVLAMLGEQFMVGEEICGAVVSIRFQEDILSIWNRTACDTAVTARIRDTFKRVLNLASSTVIEYKAHNDSIK